MLPQPIVVVHTNLVARTEIRRPSLNLLRLARAHPERPLGDATDFEGKAARQLEGCGLKGRFGGPHDFDFPGAQIGSLPLAQRLGSLPAARGGMLVQHAHQPAGIIANAGMGDKRFCGL